MSVRKCPDDAFPARADGVPCEFDSVSNSNILHLRRIPPSVGQSYGAVARRRGSCVSTWGRNDRVCDDLVDSQGSTLEAATKAARNRSWPKFSYTAELVAGEK